MSKRNVQKFKEMFKMNVPRFKVQRVQEGMNLAHLIVTPPLSFPICTNLKFKVIVFHHQRRILLFYRKNQTQSLNTAFYLLRSPKFLGIPANEVTYSR